MSIGYQWNMDDSIVEESENTFQSLFCDASPEGKIYPTDLIHALALTIFLSISACVRNTLILVALHKVFSLHPPSKLLFRCLAITDILAGLVSQPVHVIYLFSIMKMNEQWAELCLYTAAFSVIISTTLYAVSMMTTAAISMDRLLALMLGLRYRQVVTFKRTLAAVLCFWLTSMILAAVFFRKYTIHKSVSYIVMALILVCLATSAFCYAKIAFMLRQHQNQIQAEQNGASFTTPNLARLRKIVYSALWVQGALVACYVPFLVVTGVVVSNSGARSQSLYIAWEFTTILLFLNSSLNPFLYCFKIKEVRQAVKYTIRQMFCLSN